jgi:4-hydroxy-tetrahydrodipicolinate synthase
VGGCGVVSVVANVAPAKMAELCNALLIGDNSHAFEVHLELIDLCQAMFYETNPIPVKTAAGLMGLCSPELRLPLSPMQAGNVEKLKQVLQSHNLLPVN